MRGAPRGPENLRLLLRLLLLPGWWSWSKTKSGDDPSAHLCLATLAPSFSLSSHPGRGVAPPGNTRGLPPLRSRRFGSMGPRRSRDGHVRFPVREREGHGGVPPLRPLTSRAPASPLPPPGQAERGRPRAAGRGQTCVGSASWPGLPQQAASAQGPTATVGGAMTAAEESAATVLEKPRPRRLLGG